MTIKKLTKLALVCFFLSCGSNNELSETFKQNATGRFLYNSDEVIETYFQSNDLFIKWRGANEIKPMKVNDNVYFVKEMNEKIQFLQNPTNDFYYIALVPKEKTDDVTYNYKKLKPNEHVPSYYLKNGDFEKAKIGYINIQKKDSLDPNISEVEFNRLGYRYLREKKVDKAIAVFSINVALYPNSANVYDSYGEALLKKGDSVNGILNYKKALKLNSDNKRAKRIIEAYNKSHND